MKIPIKSGKTPEQRNRIVGVVLGLVVAVAVGLSFHEKAEQLPVASKVYDIMKGLEYKVYDFRFRLRGSMSGKHISQDIVLLDIDDESYDWQPWPFDRLYWAEVIRALGTEGSKTKATFFDVFFFDPSGPKLSPGMANTFSEKMSKLPQEITQDQELLVQIKTGLDDVANKLMGPMNPDGLLSARTELLSLINNEQFSLKIQTFNEIGMFIFENQDLSALAPDRDAVLSDAIKYAGNVFLAQVVSKREHTPYGVEDVLFNPRIHDIFARLIQLSDRTKTNNAMEVKVNYALRNMKVEDFERLLTDSKKDSIGGRTPLPFTKEERKCIEEELKKVKITKDKALAINMKYGADIRPDNPIPKKEIISNYTDIVQMQTVLPMFGENAMGVGFVMPELQKYDGTIRAAAPAVVYDGRVYFHIDMLLAKRYLGVENKNLDFYRDKVVMRGCRLPGGKKPITITIPLYENGKMYVDWAGKYLEPNQFVHRSFRVVYDDAVKYNVLKKREGGGQLTAPEREIFDSLTPKEIKRVKKNIEFFNGKIVMIGLTASETHDLNPVPFHPRYPLVGMHANALNTIVNRLFIRLAPFWILFIVIIGLSVATGYAGAAAKQAVSSAITAGLVIGYAVVSFFVFTSARLWIAFIPAVLSIVLTYMLVIIYRFMTEGREARKMKAMFSTYVSPEVVEQLIHHPEMLRLGGEKMNLSAMFSLASGPGLSEAESPEELVDRLNEYFTEMTEHIFANQGMLDKYEGSIIMAVFGAPIHYPENPVTACYAALDMHKATLKLHEKWAQEGKKPIHTSVGLNSGFMIAGNMGSESRFNYTIMGDAVNLAARLLGANKQYNTRLIMSQYTREMTKDHIHARLLDKILVVGKLEAIEVYELVGRKDVGLPREVEECVRLFDEGYGLYLQMKWDEAIGKFRSALEARPDDGPSKVYIGRCEDFKAEPPELDKEGKWNGVYAMKAK